MVYAGGMEKLKDDVGAVDALLLGTREPVFRNRRPGAIGRPTPDGELMGEDEGGATSGIARSRCAGAMGRRDELALADADGVGVSSASIAVSVRSDDSLRAKPRGRASGTGAEAGRCWCCAVEAGNWREWSGWGAASDWEREAAAAALLEGFSSSSSAANATIAAWRQNQLYTRPTYLSSLAPVHQASEGIGGVRTGANVRLELGEHVRAGSVSGKMGGAEAGAGRAKREATYRAAEYPTWYACCECELHGWV